MILPVESNFVLELAFRQDEVAHCEQLLALAEQKVIELVIPGCSLFEPYETFARRNKHRGHIASVLQAELAQLARSEGHAHLLETSKVVRRALVESGQVQGGALDTTIERISNIATVIPLTTEVVREAAEGGEAVKATVGAMKHIAEKIGIIDDIAYQTSLLALEAKFLRLSARTSRS